MAKIIYGILSYAFGLFCIIIAIIAFLEIETKDTGMLITIIEALRESFLMNFLIFLLGHSYVLSAKDILLGKKAVLDINVDYQIVSIETNDAEKMVKINLKDPVSDNVITIERNTDNIVYFKEYLKERGNKIFGSIASTV